MKAFDFIALLLLGGLSACAQQAQSESPMGPPSWLHNIMIEDSKKPFNNATQAIWKISHQGKIAYFIVSPCCDQYNPLLDENGKQLCSPSGGITGHGDGRCPKPADAGTKPILIWSHPQSPVKHFDASDLIAGDTQAETNGEK